MTRLTQLSHGGGCGCKISPAVLSEILKELPLNFIDKNLLVGAETSDDAAVYKINDEQAVVLTTDFFMPIVDDAYDFGRIAATNAISDVFAMGGTPIMALAVLGMPLDKLAIEDIREIMRGGVDVCRAAGIPLAGGHSIDAPEPIFGLVAAGLVDPRRVKKNSSAKEGDALILFKPLGVGILTTALKRGLLEESDYRDVLTVMTQLNVIGKALSELEGVHALTDITGFGLAGHLLEVCRGSKLRAEVEFTKVPILESAKNLARTVGCFPGGAERNLKSFEQDIHFSDSLSAAERLLLCDPQTSGGILACVEQSSVEKALSIGREFGFVHGAVVGELKQGKAQVAVR